MVNSWKIDKLMSLYFGIIQQIPAVELTVIPTTLEFGDLGGEDYLTVISNTNWTVTKTSWINVDPSNGSGNDTITVLVVHTSIERTGYVWVTAGAITRTITIHQTAM